jgi:hypothetical protein
MARALLGLSFGEVFPQGDSFATPALRFGLLAALG